MKQYTALTLIILAFASCKEHKVEKTEKQFTLSDTMQRMITLDTVRYCGISDEVTLTGQVASNENTVVKIYPRSSGQVLQAPYSLGDFVHKGQVLAVIRSAEVAGSFSDLSSANADIAIAKRQMDNAHELYKNGISSEKEYTEAKQNYEKALAAKNKVQSNIRINGGNAASSSGQYMLTSPIDGYIIEKKVSTGSFIRSDASDNLFTISDLKNVWVYANVYEADIPKIKEGYPVQVFANSYPDKVFPGKIDKVSQVLDPQSKALRARITIDNSEKLLKPDMFARIVVSHNEQRSSLCIPTSALMDVDGKKYVITYSNPHDLKVAEVDVNKTVEDKTFINSGVQPGQKVITKYQNLVFAEIMNQ